VDWNIDKDRSIGLNFRYRDIKSEPIFFFGGPERNEEQFILADLGEIRSEIYYYHILNSNLSFDTSVVWELLEQEEIVDAPTIIPRRRTRTWSLPLSVRYFDERGFFGRLAATFFSQKIEEATDDIDDRSTSAIFDVAVGYKIPRVKGSLSIELNNIFDQDFKYQDVNFRTNETINPKFTPERTLLARATFHF
jgi:hypothetical protein